MTRPRSGIIILVDVLVVLVLVLASRLEPTELDVKVNKNQKISIENLVTVISNTGTKEYEYLTNYGWVKFSGKEDWISSMIVVPCNEVCNQYMNEKHSKLEILIIGNLAKNLALEHFNSCQNNRKECRNNQYLIENSDYLVVQK